ncbi:unnamed protein product [Diatraea saccharalis]|uniref:Lysozyme n=1 Tax=Diatraea saccharalis TaxID=40085 RepID=A0A9N9WC00_9NEOP|nr:unnamed protein product [Diatraea saccharalis]
MVLVCAQCEAKTFSLCGLVRELRKQNFPEHEMRDWVCLVEKESSRRTHVIGPPNDDGSRDHGLFQINDHYWCNDSNVPGKGCHVTCQQMRTDDITAASTCAKKIYRRHGFNAWYGWVNHCRGKALPDISHC